MMSTADWMELRTVERKIGLVLSGGGAKGAYEVGVWKALEQIGIVPYIDGIYGTSVGALNAALFDTCGGDRADQIWSNLETSDFYCLGTNKNYSGSAVPLDEKEKLYNAVVQAVLRLNGLGMSQNIVFHNFARTVVAAVTSAVYGPSFYLLSSIARASIRSSILSMLKNLIENGLPFTQQRINELIKENVDFGLQKRKIVAFCMQSKKPHQVIPFDLEHYDFRIRRNILLASSAIPFFYQGRKGIQINGQGYFDGGVDIGKNCKGKNTPILPMLNDGWKYIICVWLDPAVAPKITCDPNIVHIIPSSPTIGKFFDGTIKVDRKKIQQDIHMGYMDTYTRIVSLKLLAARINYIEVTGRNPVLW